MRFVACASPIILASASPRRADLLLAAGMAFEVQPAHIDERIRDGEAPATYVRRLAEDKARAVGAVTPGRVVLAADTVVLVDGQILGKPGDADDARRMLRLLSGRVHEVMTGVALIGPPEGDPREVLNRPPETGAPHAGADSSNADVRIATTRVEFAPLSAAELDWYVGSGEPLDKAGAYAIQGLASRFVTRIEGSYSNVVGLPMALVYEMCTRAGILVS